MNENWYIEIEKNLDDFNPVFPEKWKKLYYLQNNFSSKQSKVKCNFAFANFLGVSRQFKNSKHATTKQINASFYHFTEFPN